MGGGDNDGGEGKRLGGMSYQLMARCVGLSTKLRKTVTPMILNEYGNK